MIGNRRDWFLKFTPMSKLIVIEVSLDDTVKNPLKLTPYRQLGLQLFCNDGWGSVRMDFTGIIQLNKSRTIYCTRNFSEIYNVADWRFKPFFPLHSLLPKTLHFCLPTTKNSFGDYVVRSNTNYWVLCYLCFVAINLF